MNGCYPHTTGLQAWTVAVLAQLDAAQEQLEPVEYEALLDCIRIAVARETAACLLVLPEAEAA